MTILTLRALLTSCDFFGPTDFLQMDANRLLDGEIHNAPDSPESKLVGGPIQDNPKEIRNLVHPARYLKDRHGKEYAEEELSILYATCHAVLTHTHDVLFELRKSHPSYNPPS